MVANLAWAASGEQSDPGLRGVEAVFCGKVRAADGGQRQLRQRMTHKLGLDTLIAVEGLLEGEDDQHAVNILANQLDAVLLPGPQLRADEVEDRNAEPVELFGQTEVDLGEVDENGDAGPARANGFLELAKLAPDARQMADDLCEAHNGHLFRTDDALKASGGHALAAHAKKLRRLAGGGKALFEGVDYQRAVMFAAGLACRNEDALGHIGCAGDHDSGLDIRDFLDSQDTRRSKSRTLVSLFVCPMNWLCC